MSRLVCQSSFIATRGLNLGVDFTGGTVLEVSYEQTADLNKIRNVLIDLELTDATVQNFGTSRDVMIRLPVKPEYSSAQLSEIVLSALRLSDDSVEMRRVEFVGPQVGKELLEKWRTSAIVCVTGNCCISGSTI